MNKYFYHIRLLILRLLLLIFVFFLSRIVFHLFNYGYFNVNGLNELGRIYLGGLRYDLVILSIFNAILVIMHALPGEFKENFVYQRFIKIYFVIVNGALLGLNFIDTKYFDFTNKRSTTDVFKLMHTSEDVWNLIPLFIKDYWYLIVLWILFVTALWFLFPAKKRTDPVSQKISQKEFMYQIAFLILMCGFILLGARGSTAVKPLRAINAADYASARNIPLVLNTPFTVLKTINKEELKEVQFFSDQQEYVSYFNPVKQYPADASNQFKNVVIIIMESFAHEYIGAFNEGKGYTPHLDRLIEKSLAFPNAFANGKRSIEAVPSILLGIPTLMDNPYLTSSYATNKVRSMATILHEYGYKSAFFHGGKNGTMGFDKFLKFADFDAYYGMNEYPEGADFDGGWGIYDEPFFRFFADEMNRMKPPFITAVFSLSSHHPYYVPGKYKNMFPKGELNIHESIGYADYALGQFFEYSSQYEWFTNTLFVITADHTAQLVKEENNTSVGNYRIPVLFYTPGDTLIGTDSMVTQQIDILPSVIDFIGIPTKEVFFGNSVFDKNDRWVMFFQNGIYQILDNHYVLRFDGNNVISVFDYWKDPLLNKNILGQKKDSYTHLENTLKAFIQDYNYRLIHNKMTRNE